MRFINKTNVEVEQLTNKFLNKLILVSFNYNGNNTNVKEINDLFYLFKNCSRTNLIKKIERHKLNFFLYNSSFIKKHLPELHNHLKIDIKNSLKDILKLTALTVNISKLLNKHKIRYIFLKGIILAKQITNIKEGRGKSLDLDLLIEYKDIREIVNLFQTIGFKVPMEQNIFLNNGIYGSISRFLSQEMCMYRNKNGKNEFIDIHWRLTAISCKFDKFKELYSRHEKVNIDGYYLNSLSLNDTFMHNCAHAAVDKWMSYRNLIDISYLANKLNNEDLKILKNNKLVRWSSYASYLKTKNHKLIPLMTKNLITRFFIKRISNKYQNLPWRSLGYDGWTIRNRIEYFLLANLLTNHIIDWIRQLIVCIVRPNDIYDPYLKRQRKFHEIINIRYKNLRERLSHKKT